MRKLVLIALLAVPLAIGGCGAKGSWFPDLAKAIGSASTTEVPITKAQAEQALAEVQKGHAIAVQLQIAYLRQTPCGMPGAMAPPLCASYRIGVQMKKYDDAFTASMEAAQNDVNTLGDNPTILATAVKAAQLAYATFKNFTETNAKGVK
jgi:hypothetical protein